MAGTLDELIARIKDLPVSEVIERYVHTVRKGTQTLAVCPFHDDHSPSLTVNDQRGMWFCFVDNMGGDAIKFVMLYRKLEFMEALRDICDKLGWSFDDYHQTKKSSPKIEMGKKLLGNTMKLYRKLAETGQHKPFLDFLEKRGLSAETAKTYQLGFAPPNYTLFDYISSIKDEKDRSFALSVAEELGLIKKSTFGEKSHYDTFRDRIMFPIWDQFGQVIGFTSRSISDEQKPKYLNSLDSFLFNKKNILYGLHLAKNVIRERDQAILVEGNMDQVALYKNGFENSLAIMGVALGDSSVIKLLALSKNIVLSLDNDQPGWRAAIRINAQLMEKGVTPHFLDLGEYKDPDDFLTASGRDALAKRIEESKPFVDVQIERSFPEKIPELAERRLDLLKSVFEILSPLKNSLSATERVILYAKRLGLQSDSASIVKSYEEFLEKQNRPLGRANQQQESSPIVEMDFENQEISQEKVKIDRQLTAVESRLLQNLVQHPELMLREEIAELLDFVGNDEVKGYILKLRELMYEIDETEYSSVVQSLMRDDFYSAELTAVVGGALYKYQEANLDEKVSLKMIEDIKKNLQVEQLKEEKKYLKGLHGRAQTDEEQKHILAQLMQVEIKLSELKSSPRNKPAR
ncbi:MAG: DNA primase [Bacteriovoracaceae bacterium]|nr:DNA primase [Bacteriovoracaceae bacterium]